MKSLQMKGYMIIVFVLFLTYHTPAFAQFNESFSDGDFTNGFTWSGTNSSWIVVASSDVAAGATGSNTLRLNVASGSGTQYLSTKISGAWSSQISWGFWMGRRAQAATASNMMYVWIYANEADVTSSTVDGYRIRFGDDVSSGDKLILESVTNGAGTNILSSSPVTNGITDYGILVRVTREGSGQWNLYTSPLPSASGTGQTASAVPDANNTNILQGSVVNTTINVFDDGFIAVQAVHSTVAAARTGAEFDQMIVSFADKSPLPVRFSGVQGTITTSGVLLEWDNLTESDISHYVVERSETAREFTQVVSVAPEKNDGGRVHYSYTDRQTSEQQLYYRIKALETTGKILYSHIIRLKGNNNSKIVIYPNPVRSGSLQFNIMNLTSGKYAYTIYNNSGAIIQKSFFNHTGSGFNMSVDVSGLPAGWFILEIKGPDLIKKQFVVQ